MAILFLSGLYIPIECTLRSWFFHLQNMVTIYKSMDEYFPVQTFQARDAEPKLDVSPEEIRSILELIAATGKFWHDWDMLKNMLSFQLKQVLAEYSELQQSSLSAETYPELVKRLDEGFIEGPPFTLQRLCEILLKPKSIYHSLSKLALALEKNLLVTSTLTKCTDPCPVTPAEKPAEPNKVLQESHDNIEATTNGVSNATDNSNGDEEMVDAEADEGSANKDSEIQEAEAEEDSCNLETNSEPIPSGKPSSIGGHNASTSPIA